MGSPAGWGAPSMAAPVTTLAFNAGCNITPNWVVAFEATDQKLDVCRRPYYLKLN